MNKLLNLIVYRGVFVYADMQSMFTPTAQPFSQLTAYVSAVHSKNNIMAHALLAFYYIQLMRIGFGLVLFVQVASCYLPHIWVMGIA